MSDLARLLQRYGYGEQPNALAQDGENYDTSNVLAGMPKPNALSDALRVAMRSIPENKDHSWSVANLMRGGFGTLASWMDYPNKPQPSDYRASEMLAPPGGSLMSGTTGRAAVAPAQVPVRSSVEHRAAPSANFPMSVNPVSDHRLPSGRYADPHEVKFGPTEFSYFVNPDEIYLSLMETAAGHRGVGHGRKAMQEFLSAADQAGKPVRILPANPGLHRFFSSVGFSRLPDRSFWVRPVGGE